MPGKRLMIPLLYADKTCMTEDIKIRNKVSEKRRHFYIIFRDNRSVFMYWIQIKFWNARQFTSFDNSWFCDCKWAVKLISSKTLGEIFFIKPIDFWKTVAFYCDYSNMSQTLTSTWLSILHQVNEICIWTWK